jgi:hypothetical protein
MTILKEYVIKIKYESSSYKKKFEGQGGIVKELEKIKGRNTGFKYLQLCLKEYFHQRQRMM